MQRLAAAGLTPSNWDPQQQAEHDRLLRYRKSDQREFERAYRGVEHLRTRRATRRREKRAIAVANAAIASKNAQKPAVEVPPPPPPAEPDTWDQRVFVKIVDGAVTIRNYLTNANFRLLASLQPRPDTRILRTFRFPHGVPAEFEWMLPPEQRQPGATYAQWMPLTTWFKITEEEEKRGAFFDPRTWHATDIKEFSSNRPRAA